MVIGVTGIYVLLSGVVHQNCATMFLQKASDVPHNRWRHWRNPATSPILQQCATNLKICFSQNFISSNLQSHWVNKWMLSRIFKICETQRVFTTSCRSEYEEVVCDSVRPGRGLYQLWPREVRIRHQHRKEVSTLLLQFDSLLWKEMLFVRQTASMDIVSCCQHCAEGHGTQKICIFMRASNSS